MKKRKRPKNTLFAIFEIWLLKQFDEFQTNLLEISYLKAEVLNLAAFLSY